jgi:hypothetical protein
MDNAQNKQGEQIKKSKWPKRIFFLFLIIIASFAGYVWVCGTTYSEGSRTGVVTKVSKKGYLFKTYEGTLNLGSISSGEGIIMPTKIWDFSIQKNDTSVFNKITRTQGKDVRLYSQEVVKTFIWQGDTRYYVTKVEVVK